MKDTSMNKQADRLLFVVDHAGTILFAMEGAFAAIAGNLDFLGVMVVSFATALGGGVLRDVLIGATPPQAIRDWRYSVSAFTTGGAVFILHQFAQQIPSQLLMILDAAGLALFAVAGTQKALSYSIPPFIAILMGTITGVGGGAIRDILLMHVPVILYTDIYATAALFGSAVMVLGRRLGFHPMLAAVLGGLACFALRVCAVWFHWNLPKASAP
ncbi:MAG: trimeric intracellular cation channel family protein [Terracidiphilus sp.]